MPVQPTYPGVYIEEVPSGVRTITGVATSIAAFVDFFKRGPMNKAVQIFNFGDFEREFGGLDKRSEASYAIQQFFLNGGTEAWVVRVASESGTDKLATAAVYLNATADMKAANEQDAKNNAELTLSAISPGSWGNILRARVDSTPSGGFNLILQEEGNGRQEVFRNLSMDDTQVNFVKKIVNDPITGSKLVRVEVGTGTNAPLANGTYSGHHGTPPTLPTTATISVEITDGTDSESGAAIIMPPAGAAATDVGQALARLAPALETAIRSIKLDDPAFSGVTVEVVGDRLRVLPGGSNPANRVSFNVDANGTSDALLFTNDPDAFVNTQQYPLGGTQGLDHTGLLHSVQGADGVEPDGHDLIGILNDKTGISALEEVDLFNLLCLPRTSVIADPVEAQAVLSAAVTYCEKRRAFLLIDTPAGYDEPQEIKGWLAANATLRHKNAALFYPRVKIPDPLDDFRLRTVGASGTLAGLFARTDVNRGVWKAPAGTEATLRNVTELDDLLTDSENGTLNPLAINCLRSFPVYGNVSWGARTLVGADQMASEWKYIPVRRLALFLEESLYRGTQWVVFEPNDEPLWSQIRLNVGAFMHNLFRQGAFQGRSPREAYLVKCDRETTTQNDIDNGIVNIVVGFAPLKPAEFVIIKIQQLAGQIQT